LFHNLPLTIYAFTYQFNCSSTLRFYSIKYNKKSVIGNIATEFSDVGQYGDEDRCCREHDLCPNTLAPSECRRGLCNNGSITRSHCDCDARFRRCLQALNTGKYV